MEKDHSGGQAFLRSLMACCTSHLSNRAIRGGKGTPDQHTPSLGLDGMVLMGMLVVLVSGWDAPTLTSYHPLVWCHILVLEVWQFFGGLWQPPCGESEGKHWQPCILCSRWMLSLSRHCSPAVSSRKEFLHFHPPPQKKTIVKKDDIEPA